MLTYERSTSRSGKLHSVKEYSSWTLFPFATLEMSIEETLNAAESYKYKQQQAVHEQWLDFMSYRSFRRFGIRLGE